jgi:hypothetical protein
MFSLSIGGFVVFAALTRLRNSQNRAGSEKEIDMTRMVDRKILLATGMLLGASVCWGQHRLVANVPFDFATPAGHLPAGHYDIVAGLGGNAKITKLRHEESKKSILMVSGPSMYGQNNGLSEKSRLVFRCDGSDCSLAEIWPGGGADGSSFAQPRKRSELTARVATVTVAALEPNKATTASTAASDKVDQKDHR